MDPLLSNEHLPNESKCREITKTAPQLKNELSELEIVMDTFNVGVKLTPEGHCEIAGRGIECL